MNNQNTSDKLKERSKKIDAIYNEAVIKIRELENKQKEIVSDYIKKLEQAKIEEIRESIKKKS